MNTHGVYVSFGVLLEVVVALTVSGIWLTDVGVYGLVVLFPIVVLVGLYSLRLWSIREEHRFGLWQLQIEEGEGDE